MTAPADSKSRPVWRFDYYYDAVGLTDRYDHKAGQGDELCSGIRAFQNGEPCIVLNAADGKTYVASAAADCCIFPVHIGAVRPDWLRGGKRNGTASIREEVVEVWTVAGQYVNFYASSLDERRRPVRYWEQKVPGPQGLKQWDFDLSTFNYSLPNASVFDPATMPGRCLGAAACDWHKPSGIRHSIVV